MALKASDELIQELLAPHLTSDDGDMACVYGLHEPYDDWIMYWFFGGLLRLLLLKHLLIAVTQRRLLLMEISGFYHMKNCQLIEFDELSEVQVREPKVLLGTSCSIVRLRVPGGKKYRVTIRPAHPGISKHPEHYRVVMSIFKSLAGEPGAQLASRPCPRCAERVKVDAAVCRFCNYRFSEQEIAAARSQAQARASFLAEDASRTRLRRRRKRHLLAGWTLTAVGGLLVLFLVLGTVVPAPQGQPQKDFELGPFLGGLACILVAFMAPGMFFLSRAWKLARELATPAPVSHDRRVDSPNEHVPANSAQATNPRPNIESPTVICSGCRKKLRLKAAHQGKKVKCPYCHTITPVPA